MEKTDENPEFELAAPVVKPRRSFAQFQRAYRDYAAVYKSSVRTLKGWVEIGKDAGDLPPLDEPIKMPDWWAAHMKQKCPDKVLDAARADRGDEVKKAPSLEPIAPSRLATVPVPVFGAVSSLDENLQHLKEQCERARREHLEELAKEPPDFAQIESKQRKWRELRAEVEGAEVEAFKLKAKQGKLVDMDLVASEMTPRLVTVATSIRSLIARVWPQLQGCTSLDAAEQVWQPAVDDCFGEMIANGFVHRDTLRLAA